MKYNIVKSEIIVKNQESMIEDIKKAHAFFVEKFGERSDSTWQYQWYNAFAVTSPSSNFYNLYKELSKLIRDFIGTDEPLWLACWINFHMPNEVLDWHDHVSEYHGYISIEPHKTKTIWKEGLEINNEVGNIYLGEGYKKHKVVVQESFDTPRITLGFDVLNNPLKNCAVIPVPSFNLMPIL